MIITLPNGDELLLTVDTRGRLEIKTNARDIAAVSVNAGTVAIVPMR